MTKPEKIALYYQLEALRFINSQETKEYELIQTCITKGYDQDLEEHLPHIEEQIDYSTHTEVHDILNMYAALQGYEHGVAKSPLPFVGFDANEETKHYAYAKFLFEERGLWSYLKPKDGNYNTHTESLDKYHVILDRWHELGKPDELTPEQTAYIAEKPPYGI